MNSSEEEVSLKQQVSKKIIVGVLAIFAILAGLIFFLGRYYKATGQAVQRIIASKDAGVFEAVEVRRQYLQGFNDCLDDYFSAAKPPPEDDFQDFAVKTRAAQTCLLDLRSPGDFKDEHLEAVLLLAEIERRAKLEELSGLKEIFQELKGFLREED